jgi:hypothetical protein
MRRLGVLIASLLAGSLVLAAAPVTPRAYEDEMQEVEVLPGTPGADLAAYFRQAGWEDAEARRLAELVTFGPEAMNAMTGCQYYELTTVWCDGLTRRLQRTYVGTTCIEGAGLHLCALLSCPSGQTPWHKTVTAASGCPTGIPGGACAYVKVTGPHTTEVEAVCNSLSDCTCWPNMVCGDRECVPISTGSGHPTKCPNCN